MQPDLFGARRGPPPDSLLGRLLGGPMGEGTVVWIGLRPARRALVLPVTEAVAEPGRGLRGDRYARADGARQVTLIAEEHLAAIGSFLGRAPVEAGCLRRNIVVRGINLLALKDRRFRIGEAALEWSGECHPCSRMEEELGRGGYNAVRRHGGITARVVGGGRIRLGDGLARLDDPA
ncbi:MOSC domain-containing protein [Roseomonas sp. CCTCC AB2023176]|uniref:MOSC domain-containing protein n=1 Tax=Roseomonas sp. CCTCC AB2023176 TaxID=3342640 RepID=UPI0035DAA6F7